jgi:hypothetical protein
VLDNTLGQSVSGFVSFGVLLIGTLAVMAWVMPALLPCLVPIGALYFYVQNFFRPGYREVGSRGVRTSLRETFFPPPLLRVTRRCRMDAQTFVPLDCVQMIIHQKASPYKIFVWHSVFKMSAFFTFPARVE